MPGNGVRQYSLHVRSRERLHDSVNNHSGYRRRSIQAECSTVFSQSPQRNAESAEAIVGYDKQITLCV